MDTLLEALLESPLLPRQVERLNQALAEERPRRERFYEEMTEEGKWEFINGEVIMHSPARYCHTETGSYLIRLLGSYVDHHDLGFVGYEKVLVCLTRNDYEPDICFFRREIAATFMPDQMKFPAPDFIAEILSPSTARHDRGVKFRDYAAHGVAEYWVIDPVAQAVEQHALRGEDYQRLGVWTGEDQIASVAVENFRLPARALFDRQANMAALAALLAKA